MLAGPPLPADIIELILLLLHSTATDGLIWLLLLEYYCYFSIIAMQLKKDATYKSSIQSVLWS